MIDSEELILSIQGFPCLWDESNPEYHQKDMKDISWNEVCNAVVPKFQGMDENKRQIIKTQIKRKWANIRDYYRKGKREEITGQALSKRKKYYASEILCFLDPVLKLTYTENVSEDISHQTKMETSIFHVSSPEYNSSISPSLSRHTNSPPPPMPTFVTTTPLQKRNKKKKNDFESKVLDLLQSRNQEDCDTKFLLSFVGSMNKMTDTQKLDFKIGMTVLLKKILTSSAEMSASNI